MYSILNVHGLWTGQGKRDTQERIYQSQRIRHFMDTINTPKILCGDFNLRPDTESMHIIEQGMINLITLNKVRSTRTRFYKKEEKYADYILTSPEITVNQFTVLNDEVSDHAPLYLDFNQ
jgi:endonuclease/exonuclease/phosphatase family metal-dependent hydrolase